MPDLLDGHPRAAGWDSDPVDAHPSPRKPGASLPILGFERHELAPGWRSWSVKLAQDPPVGAEQAAKPSQERDRSATDADVAVEQQRGAPVSRAGQRREHRAVHDRGSACAGAADRGRGDVHAGGQNAPPGQRQHVTPGAAADVEHGAERAIEHAGVGGGGRPEPLLEREVSPPAVLAAHVQRPPLERGRI